MKKILITAIITFGLASGGSTLAVMFYSPQIEVPSEKPVIIQKQEIVEVKQAITGVVQTVVKAQTVEQRLSIIEARLDLLENK